MRDPISRLTSSLYGGSMPKKTSLLMRMKYLVVSGRGIERLYQQSAARSEESTLMTISSRSVLLMRRLNRIHININRNAYKPLQNKHLTSSACLLSKVLNYNIFTKFTDHSLQHFLPSYRMNCNKRGRL